MDASSVALVVWVFPVLCHGFVFTSTPNVTSETCDGGDFTFNWTYTSGTPTTIAWTKRNNDGTFNATLATVTSDTFEPDTAYGSRVTRVGTNAAIKLSGLTAADNGIYQVELTDFSGSLKGNTTLSSFADADIVGNCEEVPVEDYTVSCRMQVVTPVTLQLLVNNIPTATASSETGIKITGFAAFGKELKCSAIGEGQQCMKNNNKVIEVPVPHSMIACIIVDVIGIITLGALVFVGYKSQGTWRRYAAYICAVILIIWTIIMIIVIPVKYSEGHSEPSFIVAILFTVIGLILGGVAPVFLLVRDKCSTGK